jgi:hypothetical protein
MVRYDPSLNVAASVSAQPPGVEATSAAPQCRPSSADNAPLSAKWCLALCNVPDEKNVLVDSGGRIRRDIASPAHELPIRANRPKGRGAKPRAYACTRYGSRATEGEMEMPGKPTCRDCGQEMMRLRDSTPSWPSSPHTTSPWSDSPLFRFTYAPRAARSACIAPARSNRRARRWRWFPMATGSPLRKSCVEGHSGRRRRRELGSWAFRPQEPGAEIRGPPPFTAP